MELALVQDSIEIEFIKKRYKGDIKFFPLSLDAFLYLEENNIEYINPKKLSIDQELHNSSIVDIENLLKKINLDNYKNFGLKTEIKSQLRFTINFSVFLIEVIKKLTSIFKINKFILSGWDLKNNSSNNSNQIYLITRTFKNLDFNLPYMTISNFTLNAHLEKEKVFTYKPIYSNKIFNSKNKKLLVNNLGYNFLKIVFLSRLKNIKSYLISFDEVKFDIFKKLLFKILGLNIIFCKREKIQIKNHIQINLPDLIYKNINLSKVIFLRLQELEYLSVNIKNKLTSVESILKNVKFDYYFSNSTRGVDGGLIELLNSRDTKTVCISHGTVSRAYNERDKIYKNIISESVLAGPFKYFAAQSKICNDFLINQKVDQNKIILSGNLIFANSKNKLKKKYILFATTLKPLHGLQFLGVEMYYEFLENLKVFSDLSKDENLDFVVNIHPSHKNTIKELRNIFPGLTFKSENISKLLKHTIATISFSSTAIEDSLASNVPVILFDQWKRYKHYHAEEITNSPIFYENTKEGLLNKIKKIIQKDLELNFQDLLYGYNLKKNFDNLIKKIN